MQDTILHVYDYIFTSGGFYGKTSRLTHDFNQGDGTLSIGHHMRFARASYGYNVILLTLYNSNINQSITSARIYDSYWNLKSDLNLHISTYTYLDPNGSFIHKNLMLYYQTAWKYVDGTSTIYAVDIVDSYLVKATTEVEFNGLSIDGQNIENLKYMIWGQNNIALKYCDIYSRGPRDDAPIELFDRFTLHITGIPTIQNSIIRDGWDIYLDVNTADILYSQFYRLQGGLTIDGAAAVPGNININHCDYFANYTGLKFENNSGNEKIRNSIFHNVPSESIEADNQVTLDNSLLTSDTINVTENGCIHANPLYINEGASDPAQIDLNLKIRDMGYLATSPAYGLGDGSENAGSCDVSYNFKETSRTEIVLPKENLNIDYIPVNAVTQKRADGSARFYKDAIQEAIEVPWDSLLADDFDKVLAMVASEKDSVLIYPEPVSNPTYYFEATLTWKNLAGSRKIFANQRPASIRVTVSSSSGNMSLRLRSADGTNLHCK